MDNRKDIALITGITGQDGSYLAENLLSRGYTVIGVKRRTSSDNTGRLKNALTHPKFRIEEGDICDPAYIFFSLLNNRPTHVFNLAAQSHVATSFTQPMATFDITGKAVLNFLEGIRLLSPSTRFYQASSSEMFGDSISYLEMDYNTWRIDTNYEPGIEKEYPIFQDESTPFNPQSPYAIAKLAAHNLISLYRKSYGLFCVSGILFNHESPRRGDLFVTKKISNYCRYLKNTLNNSNIQTLLELGNTNVFRDWGHASDYVEAMRLMMEAAAPNDYVVGTGETHSVEDFLREAFSLIGIEDYRKYVMHNLSLYRPSDVPFLRSLPEKIKVELGWTPKISFKQLVKEMVDGE